MLCVEPHATLGGQLKGSAAADTATAATTATAAPPSSTCCRRSSKIALRKGKSDAQKAKLYGKIGKQIAQAVRQGGPDLLANARLRDCLAAARLAQVPVDIVDRNIKRASESKADYAEMTYEAYGVGGTGFVIECLTGRRWRCG